MNRPGRPRKRVQVLRNPCPTCYSDGVQTAHDVRLDLVGFTCPRGHLWTATMENVVKHTRWVGNNMSRLNLGRIRQGEQ